MSKFLKIIVNLVVLLAIVTAAALLVPPFAGIDTVMNDNTETETNLPVGSVAYGKTVSVNKLKKNDRIIYNDGTASSYVYEIKDMDTSAGVYEVEDIYNKNSDAEGITLQKEASRVIVIVPFIGYAAIALQTKEGLIIIGLGIVFLVILFILSELWRKDSDEDEDEEEDEEEDEDEEEEPEEKLSRRERRRLRKEEKRRRKLEEEEYEEEDEAEEDEEEEEILSRKERRRLKKEEKRRRKLEKKGLLPEDEDEEEEKTENPFQQSSDEAQSSNPEGYDDAMKEAMSSIALGVARVSEPEQTPDATIAMPDAAELEKAVSEYSQETVKTEEPAVEEKEESADESLLTDIESEITYNIEETEIDETPVSAESVLRAPTVQELLAKAQAAGEAPEVKEDKENDVTLLDYSDIL